MQYFVRSTLCVQNPVCSILYVLFCVQYFVRSILYAVCVQYALCAILCAVFRVQHSVCTILCAHKLGTTTKAFPQSSVLFPKRGFATSYNKRLLPCFAL